MCVVWITKWSFCVDYGPVNSRRRNSCVDYGPVNLGRKEATSNTTSILKEPVYHHPNTFTLLYFHLVNFFPQYSIWQTQNIQWTSQSFHISAHSSTMITLTTLTLCPSNIPCPSLNLCHFTSTVLPVCPYHPSTLIIYFIKHLLHDIVLIFISTLLILYPFQKCHCYCLHQITNSVIKN